MGKQANNEGDQLDIQQLIGNLQKLTEIEKHQSELQKLLETYSVNQDRMGEVTITIQSHRGEIIDQSLIDEAKKLIEDQ